MTDIRLTSGEVIIEGPATVTNGFDVTGPTVLSGTLQVDEGARVFKKLEVEGKALVRASLGKLPTGVPISMQIDVADAIVKLQQEVAVLKKALDAAQDNWRWCSKCEGLFFGGNPTHGKCPADGQPHTLQGSGNYRLVTK